MKSVARVTLSHTATANLKQIAQKTRLTPNVIARFAMLASFEHDSIPAPDLGKPELVINQSSLFGELEPFLLTAFSAKTKGVVDSDRSKLLAAHIARGAAHLTLRVNSVIDLVKLCIT
ncbi:MAG TPA: DndE family protein [Candidatus Rubrimentiphilum sp.]|nr:DndE family protein [Candidatus Rubrimentiphilum sp.]